MLLFIALLLASGPCQASVDLHAHLFMKEGMGWLFDGGFMEPIRARHPSDGRKSQVNDQLLAASQQRIVVAALYGTSWLTGDAREPVRAQIKLAQGFVGRHPQWVLAKSSSQARAALSSGKHVLVLALEGAWEVLETEDDFKEFVDQAGIRIVTPLHLMDDPFGGVALLAGWLALSSPQGFWHALMSGATDSMTGARLNPHGLTRRGEDLIADLMARHVWIDLAHASDVSAERVVRLYDAKGLPLLVTHTSLRNYLRAERGITDSMLDAIARTRGMVGLMPAPPMLQGTPPSPDCRGSLGQLAFQWEEAARHVGRDAVALGSDTNGAIAHLGPSCQTGTPLDTDGWVDYRAADWTWKSLWPGDPDGAVARFLQAWARVEG